ncbi:hypothetical protein [Cellulosilyticum ruminicola]|uniref:hypothetical protein n=1 Tax=Cellulosilyticum ruminicola TaxID=425254 RepID=UPI0006D02701|nr:hypothetical protein [Cellulosilyticum ruminicola]
MIKRFIQVYRGNVVYDTKGYGKKLKIGVENYIQGLSKKSLAEKQQAIAWCEKMLDKFKEMMQKAIIDGIGYS